jgi:hypothetical protein
VINSLHYEVWFAWVHSLICVLFLFAMKFVFLCAPPKKKVKKKKESPSWLKGGPKKNYFERGTLIGPSQCFLKHYALPNRSRVMLPSLLDERK